MKINLTAISVCFGCIALFVITIYLLLYDLDYFITKKSIQGEIEYIVNSENKIYIVIKFNDLNGIARTAQKTYAKNYLDDIQSLDRYHTELFYTTWFKQVFISGIKTPRFLIIIIELVIAFVALKGVCWSYASFKDKKSYYL